MVYILHGKHGKLGITSPFALRDFSYWLKTFMVHAVLFSVLDGIASEITVINRFSKSGVVFDQFSSNFSRGLPDTMYVHVNS
jgi:hypothetical protein